MSDRIRSRPEVQRWALPVVDGPIVSRRSEDDTEARRARLRADHSRGYEEGLAAGRAQAQKEIEQLRARVARLDSMLKLLARPLEQLEPEVENQLTLLALTTAKHLLRRELRTDPAQVIAVIRECVARLPAATRDVRVHLHPEDAAVVREHLPTPTSERAWTIVEDPALARGGCLVRTATSQIDARLDSRINAIVSAALGDERASSRTMGGDGAGASP